MQLVSSIGLTVLTAEMMRAGAVSAGAEAVNPK